MFFSIWKKESFHTDKKKRKTKKKRGKNLTDRPQFFLTLRQTNNFFLYPNIFFLPWGPNILQNQNQG